MREIPEIYENNPDFWEFLSREFNHTGTNATIEELAQFAFGSVDAAIEAYEKEQKKIEDRKNET